MIVILSEEEHLVNYRVRYTMCPIVSAWDVVFSVFLR